MRSTTQSNTNINSIITIGLKSLVLVGLASILYYQLWVRHDINNLTQQYHQSIQVKHAWIYISLALFLMPVNWLLESLKWKFLINKFQQFSLWQAVASVLSGVSMAIMTPARLGEYGGRLVGIHKEKRPKAILSNLISSLSQNIINIGIGILTAILFFNTYMELPTSLFYALLSASFIIIFMLLLVYFRLDLLDGLLRYLPQYKWITKVRESVTSLSSTSTNDLLFILSISGLRYTVYLGQYVLLIYFFGVTTQIVPAILGVSTLFFLQSNLPLPPALSVLARGEMAIFLWSVFTSNVLGIIAATFSLWIINLVAPAILGGFVISQAKMQ